MEGGTVVMNVASSATSVLAFEDFVAGRLPALLRYATLVAGNRHDASDLVQSALEKTGVRWRTVSANGSPEAYVRRAILNAHVSRWRRRRREVLVQDTPEVPWSTPAAAWEHGELWAGLQKLPPRQRAVIVLRYYEDLSEREIAQALGIAPGTVKSQAARALDALRSTLADSGSTDTNQEVPR
jgi:RNA polymerase sigma-70 factor (sigma-E family)